MKFPKKKYLQETVELNITAFLNLMVILVPFLLITAVFSRLTVLELNLPALDAKPAEQDEKIKLQLQLVIRADRFIIQDQNLGVIKAVDRNVQNFNWKVFDKVLLEIKRRFPDEQGITLMLDKDVEYKTMIQVMDRVRSADVVQVTDVVNVELFPNISIADAPAITVVPEVSQ